MTTTDFYLRIYGFNGFDGFMTTTDFYLRIYGFNGFDGFMTTTDLQIYDDYGFF
jgi:hypothetical protein